MWLFEVGMIVVFDCSWYGCVLVECVEGFVSEVEWCVGYDVINVFEVVQVDVGIMLVKLFVYIMQKEQDKWFKVWVEYLWKYWKIGFDDFYNCLCCIDYLEVMVEMFVCIDIDVVLWIVIDGNDKKVVWIVVLIVIVDWLEENVLMMLFVFSLEVFKIVKVVLWF